MALKTQIVLFFFAGMIPTKAEEEAAGTLGLVRYRNGAMATKEGKIEKCDAVAGAVPPQYLDGTKFKGTILDVKVAEVVETLKPPVAPKGGKKDKEPPAPPPPPPGGSGTGGGEGRAPWETGAGAGTGTPPATT